MSAANPANSTPVQLFTCNGSTAQQWTVADDGTIRALGKCLDIAAASTANGARVQIYDCNGTWAQQWSPNAGQLVNPTSGKCLDATGSNSADGTPLQIWSCTAAANQSWALPTGGGTTPPPSGGFTHPGVLVSRGQLDFVRGRVQAGAQPWAAAYNQMMSSRYASLSRTPAPRSVVECGSYSNPNNGCTDEREDAIAAYTDALAWYVTGDARYAQKSIQIMDAWSATITAHTGSNAPPADRLGRLGLAPSGRDHQVHVHELAQRQPLRHHAAQRLPADGAQRLEQQRQLGTDHDGGQRRHRGVPR
ncbi:ricin-type beta-trefoil lectin domain protein [Micromonospora arida]|uniref:ricin-type beta-trefoil lectin domain protein n=1 Tax=Micromonospora arida TaxID=2203715 RepID=UPI003688CD1A